METTEKKYSIFLDPEIVKEYKEIMKEDHKTFTSMVRATIKDVVRKEQRKQKRK